MTKRIEKLFFFLVPVFLFSFFVSPVFALPQVEIWDNGVPAWTTIFASGDPVDNGTANNAGAPQIAVDSNGIVYIAFIQTNGTENHIYLSRYDGTDVRIWDNGGTGWTTTFALGDPIDTGTANTASSPQLFIDSANNVYVTFVQSDGINDHIYLSRYDGTDVRIWDNGGTGWTTTFANGDPIDTGTANDALSPQLSIDTANRVYITFVQSNGVNNHIYLSRYDGTDVRIWDRTINNWSLTFADGDAIDTTPINLATAPQIAIDGSNNVYVTYAQSDGFNNHVYLSRYNGTYVGIWDKDSVGWTVNFDDADPIDTGTANPVITPQIAIDAVNNVYVVYVQLDGSQNHIYLSRYDGTDVRIWDNGGTGWTTTFANGDPIDTGTANDAILPQLAIDSTNKVYMIYAQSNGTENHIYLSRYDGTDVRIWDNGGTGWTTTFANGDPIDLNTATNASNSQLTIDSNGNVYVTFDQFNGSEQHIYLSRYNGTDVRIWDNDATTWTTTFTDGDPIDTNAGVTFFAQYSQLDFDDLNNIYVTYVQSNGSNTHIYLSRYFTDTSIVAPTVTASAATGITTTGATLNGEITATGGENNTVRGFEYGTTTAYGLSTSTTGSYIAETFSFDVTSLDSATTYHFRSFATNSAGTSSSTDLTFATLVIPPVIVPPTVTASAATGITTSGATLNGEITATGGENNTVRGFEYGLTTTYGSVISETGSYSAGVFNANLTGLDSNTVYHFRFFSTNSAGTASSTDQAFTTNRSSSGSGGNDEDPFVEPKVCSGSIPEGYTACPGTVIDNGGSWAYVVICPYTTYKCQYYKSIIPIIPTSTPPITPPPFEPPPPPSIDPPDVIDDPIISAPPTLGGSTSTATSTDFLPVDVWGQIKEPVKTAIREPIIKAIALIGIFSGGLAAAASVDFVSLPFKLWGLLLSIFGLKKRNRPWGTVYDSVTKQPIDPAYVTLKNLTNNIEDTSITDLDGRYGFLVTLGRYMLSANKTNYTFPSQRLAGKTADALYNNLYFGEAIDIQTGDSLINKNIPLDPIKFDWNEFVKGKKKLMKFYSLWEKILRAITDWMFRIGFFISIFSLFFVPAPYNIVIFCLYVLLYLLRRFGLKQKALGSLTERDGDPLSFAIIRVFDSELNVEISNKVADKIGRYYCLVPKGKYYVKVEKKNDDESYSVVHTSEIFDAENGIINKNFVV